MVELSFPVACSILAGAAVVSGVLGGKTLARRIVAFVVAAPVLVLPLFVAREPAWLRAILAMGALLPPLRALDLLRDRKEYSAAFRVWFLVGLFDGRLAKWKGPRFDALKLVAIVGYGALFASALWIAHRLGPDPQGAVQQLGRWFFGAVAVYAMADFGSATLTFAYRAIGVEIPVMQNAPILSRSIQEFWADRWNRAVHAVLLEYCFRPIARRRLLTMAVLAAFAGSALLHFWLTLVVVDLRAAIWMALFFVIQGVLVLVERRLRIQRASDPIRRAWTIGGVLLPSPLFTTAFLRAVGA